MTSYLRPFRLLAVATAAVLATTAFAVAPSNGVAGPYDYPHTYAATSGLGPIPDSTLTGTSTNCQDPGTGQDGVSTLSVPVSGIASMADVTDLAVSLTVEHDFVGDLTATLVDPDGTTKATLFTRAGATTATACGDQTNLAGTYTFGDSNGGSWWATAGTNLVNVTPGGYRTSDRTGATTALTPAFSAVNPTGTWKIEVRDSGAGTTGTISAASITFRTPNPEPDTAITSGPASGKRVVPGSELTIGFASSASDLTGFQCSFDNSAFAACTSPYVVTVVQRRTHVFAVRAIDAGGAFDSSPATLALPVRGSDRCERAGSRFAKTLVRVRARTAVLQQVSATGTHQQVVKAKKKLTQAKKAYRSAKRARNRAC